MKGLFKFITVSESKNTFIKKGKIRKPVHKPGHYGAGDF